MSTTTEVVYQSALLTDAAYLSLDNSAYVGDDRSLTLSAWDNRESNNPDAVSFLSRGFSFEQFKEFRDRYLVVIHQADDGAGFSATLFEDKRTGELILSFRGTNDALDLIQDAALAIEKLQILLDDLQHGSAEAFLIRAGLLDDNGNVKPEVAGSVRIVGHSLGGHLALWAATEYPTLFSRVDTFNGAGLSYGASSTYQAFEWLYSEIIKPALQGVPLDTSRIHNYYASAGIEATATGIFAYRPGEHVPLIINSQQQLGGTALDNHSMAHLVDSLAVYRVFGALDQSLSLDEISSILDSSSNLQNDPVEKTTQALAVALGGVYANTTDAVELYQQLKASIEAGDWAGTRIVGLADTAIGEIASMDTLEGAATRFSIANLHTFALVASNAASTSNTLADFGEDYLAHRAYLLESLLRRNLLHSSNEPSLVEPGHALEYFEDLTSLTTFTAAPVFGAFPLQAQMQYRFGGAGDDTLSGGLLADVLFGGAGSDSLAGNDGADQLDGGAGDDSLKGEDGDDVLRGGSGSDTLQGGSGVDVLMGGEGADLYVFQAGDGVDHVADYDDGGDRIHIEGVDLANLDYRELQPGSGLYTDTTGLGIKIRRDAGSLLVSYGAGADAGSIRVSSYSPETGSDFGIYLGEDARAALSLQEPVTALSIWGDREPLDADPEQEGVQYSYDALGNVLTDPGSTVRRDDVLYGSADNDLLDGGDGNNRLYARAGDDWLISGAGEDQLNGDEGDDRLQAGDGRDVLRGGAGADTLEGGLGTDILSGGEGADLLYAGDTGDYALLDDADPIVGNDRDWLAGGAGNDTLVGGSGAEGLAGGGGADLIYGGAGNDQIMGDADLIVSSFDWSYSDDPQSMERVFSPASGDIDPPDSAADTIDGGTGDDWIFGGRGDDFLLGGSGADQLIGYIGSDTLDGGAQDDILFGDASVAVLDELQHGDDDLSGGDGNDQLTGGGGADQLQGGEGDDQLWGDDTGISVAMQGADRLFGEAGADSLMGGGGNDYLSGGAGADFLSADGGADTAYGGSGDDRIWGDSSTMVFDADGDDLIFGEDGKDQLVGNGGNDTIDGGADDDLIWGVDGNDLLRGGAGQDQLMAGIGDDQVYGDEGDDSLWGEAGADTLFGGGGQDTLRGNDGNDVLHGDAGDDIAVGHAGDDTLYGGEGADELGGGAGADWLAGGSGNDFMYGDEGDDYLRGEDGDDELWGDAGNDTLDGGAGNDTLNGGAGDDTFVVRSGGGNDSIVDSQGTSSLVFAGYDNPSQINLAHSWGSATVTLQVGGASVSLATADYKRLASLATDAGAFISSDLLRATEGGDQVLLAGTADSLDGLGGNDTVYGGDGSDALAGGSGADRLYGENGADTLLGGDAGDSLYGGGDGDVIEGGEGADFLYGEDGGDALRGEGGDDWLSGGNGDDTLDGGSGSDTLDGGNGNDTALFGAGSGVDWLRFSSPVSGYVDTVLLGRGITPANLNLRSYGSNDLHIRTMGMNGETLILQNYFSNASTPPLVEFRFQDDADTVWRYDDVVAGFGAAAASEGDDLIDGFATNDVLDGLGGNDEIYGGAGADTLIGGQGSDTLYGGSGDDMLEGGVGADSLYGEDGNDSIHGGEEADYIVGGAGANALYGDDGDDFIVGGGEADSIAGGAGNDELKGGSGADTYYYAIGDGNDRIVETDSLAIGGSYQDVLVFGGGIGPADVQVGPALEDFTATLSYSRFFQYNAALRLSLPDGAELLIARPDNVANYDSRIDEYRFSDSQQSIRSYQDYYNAILNVDDGHDYLEGSSAGEVLDGRGGNDLIYGAAGDDTLLGGAGEDTLIGGSGADTMDGGPGNDSLRGGDDPYPGYGVVDLYQWGRGSAHDTVWARPDSAFWVSGGEPYPADELQLLNVGWSELWAERSGNDLDLFIPASADRLTLLGYFSSGHNQVRIRNDSGGHYLLADVERKVAETEILKQVSDGDDYIIGSDIWGDVIDAGTGNDTVQGQGGNDALSGGEGDDWLLGQAGIDGLYGGAGNDTLDGGADRDGLVGGAGSDTYVFDFGYGEDRISDQDKSSGRMDIIAMGQTVRPDDVRVARVGDELVLTLADGSDGITVDRHFVTKGKYAGHHIDAVRFADGSEWSRAMLASFVAQSASGDYVLAGGNGADALAGLGGNDTLQGFAGNDSLNGGAGEDQLSGGSGDDVLDGGKGADSYYFNRGDGRDVIIDTDVDASIDVVQLGSGFDPTAVVAMREAEADLQLDFGGGDILLIRDFFLGGDQPGFGVEELRFADGTVWARWEMARGNSNVIPLAVDDAINADEDQSLAIPFAQLLANDRDPDAQTLTIGAVDSPLNGSVELDMASGEVRFVPRANYAGDAGFSYTVSDGVASASAWVGITLQPVNDVPMAVDDALRAERDQSLAIPVATLLANDSDVDGDSLQILEVAQPTNGSVLFDGAAGQITFTPDAGFEGPASFVYTLSDGELQADAVVMLDVRLPNRVPIAGADWQSTIEGRSLQVAESVLLSNDSDADGDVLQIVDAYGVSGGTASWDAAGHRLIFVPDAYFVGNARVEYELSDGKVTTIGELGVQVGIDTGGNAILGGDGADVLSGTRGDNRLYGLGGDDWLRADRGNDALSGGPGADTLEGGWGNDTYVFHLGDGGDVIDNRSSKGSDLDVLQFTAGIARDDLWFLREANDLVIGVLDSTDSVTIDEWFISDAAKLDEIRLPDGVIPASEIDLLVQAMATFDAPTGAGLVFVQEEQPLQTLLATAS